MRRYIFTVCWMAMVSIVGLMHSALKAQHIHAHDDGYVCNAAEHMPELKAEIAITRARLVKEGKLPEHKNQQRTVPPVLLHWPLRQSPGYSQFSYYVLSNYVDQDDGPGIQDFNCGNRTYNGHKGVDITIWPFWWKMMYDEQVEVVAAAAGVIVAKTDGMVDTSCSPGGSWNVIAIEHADGNTAYYGHLKTNSLTSKIVGESVEVGEFLGYVGSSGNSFSPHLHIEIQDENDIAFEPSVGPCNSGVPVSYWVDQKPYNDPTFMSLLTHDAVPILGLCPYQEKPNLQNKFDAGDNIYYSAYIHNLLAGQSINYRVRNPNGTIIHSWDFTAPATEKRYLDDWVYTLPGGSMDGVYSFNATFQGETFSHYFVVGCPTNLTVSDQTVTSNIRYAAAQTITTSGDVRVASAGETSHFQAGNKVSLNPGFKAEEGSDFVIKIDGCP